MNYTDYRNYYVAYSVCRRDWNSVPPYYGAVVGSKISIYAYDMLNSVYMHMLKSNFAYAELFMYALNSNFSYAFVQVGFFLCICIAFFLV